MGKACGVNCLKICCSTLVVQILYFKSTKLTLKVQNFPTFGEETFSLSTMYFCEYGEESRGKKQVFGEGDSFQPCISGSGLWIICCRNVASNSAFSR